MFLKPITIIDSKGLMKIMWKRVFIGVFVVTVIFLLLPQSLAVHIGINSILQAAQIPLSESGTKKVSSQQSEGTVIVGSVQCGANAYWTLDSNGVMTVSGTGKMDNCISSPTYVNEVYRQWMELDTDIKKVIVEEGITKIGSGCFYFCHELTEVSLPSTLNTIGFYAFYSCGITSIDIPDGVTTIGISQLCFIRENYISGRSVKNRRTGF